MNFIYTVTRRLIALPSNPAAKRGIKFVALLFVAALFNPSGAWAQTVSLTPPTGTGTNPVVVYKGASTKVQVGVTGSSTFNVKTELSISDGAPFTVRVDPGNSAIPNSQWKTFAAFAADSISVSTTAATIHFYVSATSNAVAGKTYTFNFACRKAGMGDVGNGTVTVKVEDYIATLPAITNITNSVNEWDTTIVTLAVNPNVTPFGIDSAKGVIACSMAGVYSGKATILDVTPVLNVDGQPYSKGTSGGGNEIQFYNIVSSAWDDFETWASSTPLPAFIDAFPCSVRVKVQKPVTATVNRNYDLQVFKDGVAITNKVSFTGKFTFLDVETPVITSVTPLSQDLTSGGSISAFTATVGTNTTGATQTYQWYKNTTNSTTGGMLIGTGVLTYMPMPSDYAANGTTYFYFVLTNTDNSSTITGQTTKSVTSSVVSVSLPPLVNAETPTIYSHPYDYTAYVDDDVTLHVKATSSDGGTLSYQWYRNTSNSASGGTAISGATSDYYWPSTSAAGTAYYYVVVTNTNAGVNGAKTVTATSYVAKVTARTAYGITASLIKNGVATISPKAAADETVTLTLIPDAGYVLDTVIVYKAGDKTVSVPVIKWSATTYSFVMPAYAVDLSITFKLDDSGVEVVQPSQKLAAYSRDGLLHVSGLTVGARFSVYDLSGILVYQNIAESDEVEITLPGRGIYLVSDGAHTVKAVY